MVAERRRGIRIREAGRRRTRAVIYRKVGQQHQYLHERRTHLVARAAQQVLAEALRVNEQHVVSEPTADQWAIPQMAAYDVTPERKGVQTKWNVLV